MKWVTLATIHRGGETGRIVERLATDTGAIGEQLIPAAVTFTSVFTLPPLRCLPPIYGALGLFWWRAGRGGEPVTAARHTVV